MEGAAIQDPDLRAMEVTLARVRTLALARFPRSQEALGAFLDEALGLARQAWPSSGGAPPEGEGAADEAPEVLAPEAARAALRGTLDQLEELMEALAKL
jgi:hypothetical protein